MTLQALRQLWDRCGGIPDDYLSIDLETTGFAFKSRKDTSTSGVSGDDLITETGYCYVRNRQAQTYHWNVLDWTRSPFVEADFLRYRLQRLAKHMGETGRQCHMTWERMAAEGEDPQDVLYAYYNRLMDAREAGHKLAGHNIVLFEHRVIQDAFHEWLGIDFQFEEEELIDTAAIEKAILTGVLPQPQESLLKYFRRVLSARTPGLRWNIDHCIEKYQLVEKYALDTKQLHTAGFDSMAVHLLIEEFRELTEG